MNNSDFEKLATTRKSIRAFRADPVARQLIEKIVTLSRTAPSGANLQPGEYIVLTGDPLKQLSNALSTAISEGLEPIESYSYFPNPMPKRYRQRQVRVGAALYESLGVDRKDKAARDEQFMRNFQFFDAPVGVVATLDRRMGKGCFMDFGMAIQTLFLAAHANGLACCGIGAMAEYGPFITDFLELDSDQIVVCGIAIGHPDTDASVNTFQTDRAPLDEFSRFLGWP